MRTPVLSLPLRFSCLFICAGCAFATQERHANNFITIHLYDYARIETGQFVEVKMVGRKIFDRAGIPTEWGHCRLTSTTNLSRVGCSGSHQGETHFVVRLLPEVMARKMGAPIRMLGISLITGSGLSVDAYVFIERVRSFAEHEQHSLQVVLGAAIAHEVGHLLLAEEGHTITGIMSARWGPKEMRDAMMGALTFSREQAEQMRANAIRRRRTRQK